MKDSDTGDLATLTYVKDSSAGTMQKFMSLLSGSSPFLTISPKFISEVNANTIIVEITETKLTVQNSFILTVTL